MSQDGAKEGRLDDAEFAFHERKNLQNRISRLEEGYVWCVIRTATISSTL